MEVVALLLDAAADVNKAKTYSGASPLSRSFPGAAHRHIGDTGSRWVLVNTTCIAEKKHIIHILV